MENRTTIQMERKLLKKLQSFRIHPRETYEDVLLRLMKNFRKHNQNNNKK